jgi:ethanolamine utilization protein EutA (predicted chaperonin)
MADPLAGFHPILEAAYFVEAPDVNRAYVVGATAAGAQVSGSAITQADVDLTGERLSAHHNAAVPTAAVAAAVAAAILAAARLDGMRGTITIPPHCGLELWDVLTITDTVANQNTTYRVNGYTMEFRAGVYRHILDLCAP